MTWIGHTWKDLERLELTQKEFNLLGITLYN